MFPLSPSSQLLGNYYKTGHVHVIPRIRPMIGCTGPIWRSAASTNVQKLQVLQSVCASIVTNAPWHFSNRQIHEDLRIPFFSNHTKALTESSYSKLADVGNP
jgi:hypothetical protein